MTFNSSSLCAILVALNFKPWFIGHCSCHVFYLKAKPISRRKKGCITSKKVCGRSITYMCCSLVWLQQSSTDTHFLFQPKYALREHVSFVCVYFSITPSLIIMCVMYMTICVKCTENKIWFFSEASKQIVGRPIWSFVGYHLVKYYRALEYLTSTDIFSSISKSWRFEM